MFFKNELKKRIKNEKGLTLIELLAVIVILAIIAAIAIPAIGNIINNSRAKAALSDAQNAIASAKIAKSDGSCGDGTTACTKATVEYSSDKFSDFTVTFDTDGVASIDVTFTKPLPGEKIPTALGATAYDGKTGKLTISEKDLNKVLD